MKPFHKSRFIRFSLIISSILFACNLISNVSSEPTAVPTPTDVPVQPTAVTAPTQAAEPTAVPTSQEQVTVGSGDLEMVMVNSFQDSFDTWNIVGLVKNNGNRFIDNIEIEVEIFDADGNSLFVDIAYTDLYNLGPGESTPFSMYIYEEMPNADNYEARIVGSSLGELERAVLDLTNTKMTIDDIGDIHITGEMINNGDRPIVMNSLAAATFDETGLIITADSYAVAVRYLDPGDVGPFRVTMSGSEDPEVVVDKFEIYVDAQFDEPITPFNIIISDAIYYLDNFDDLHLVGEVTNSDDIPLNLTLVAGIYDAAGLVLDAASTTLSFGAIGAGETLPYDFEFWGPMNYAPDMLDLADSYTIQVDGYWTWDTTVELIEISTQNDANTFDEFGGEFTGQIVNDSGGVLSYITVLVYLRDLETGQIISSDYDFIFEEIPDGGVADYTVYISTYEGFDVNTTEYYIVVKGERP